MATPKLQTIEEAAQFLAGGKGEFALLGAKSALTKMVHAVETVLGKEVEILKRTSRSTGTERLSFIMGEMNMDFKGTAARARKELEALATTGKVPALSKAEQLAMGKEAAKKAEILGKAEEVYTYLRTKGVTTEQVTLPSPQPNHVRPVVDVVLDEKIARFEPGRNTALAIERKIARSVTPPTAGG